MSDSNDYQILRGLEGDELVYLKVGHDQPLTLQQQHARLAWLDSEIAEYPFWGGVLTGMDEEAGRLRRSLKDAGEEPAAPRPEELATLHPEELVTLKEWAENDSPDHTVFGYESRNWIHRTVRKLITAYEAVLECDRKRELCRTHREIGSPPNGMACPECGIL